MDAELIIDYLRQYEEKGNPIKYTRVPSDRGMTGKSKDECQYQGDQNRDTYHSTSEKLVSIS